MPQLIITGIEAPTVDAEARAKTDEFLRLARERFRIAEAAERDIRAKALEDLKFYAGDQWPQRIVAERDADGRPCLTINRLPELASQILNQQRQGRPQIKISPKGNGATVKKAQVIQGLTRHVELTSNAEDAYDWAFQYGVIGGFPGYIRIITEFPDVTLFDQQSFDQEIRIVRVLNPFCVYFDPTCVSPVYADAKFAFVIQDYSRDEYKLQHPNSEVASLTDFRSIGDAERLWFPNGNFRVAEYFHVEITKRKLVGLIDGTAAFEDQLPENAQIAVRNGKPLTREVEIPQVKCSVINAREVLEEKDWPSRFIPLIPVLGEELIIDNRRELSGIVRHAKDAQRQYNYGRTALVETVALAPKAPYIAEAKQIEGFEPIWQTANTVNRSVMPYHRVVEGGVLVPPPQRQFGEPPILAIANSIAQADADLKSTTRVHEPMLGAAGPEQSGRAIGLRQNQGNLSNYSFVDNLGKAIQHVGAILLDLLPKIYDRPGRVLRIVDPDQTSKMITLGQEVENADGEMEIYDLSQGAFDATASVGPGYESKRQEFVASVLELVRTVPMIGQFILDLVVRHMDWPGADEIADRLKKMLPEQLQEKKGDKNQPQAPPELLQKVEALMQQHAALVEELKQASSVIESRRMELESRERIAEVQARTQLLIAELKSQSAESQTLLRESLARIDQRIDQLNGNQPIGEEPSGSEPQPPTMPQPAEAPPTVAPPQAPSSLGA